MAAYSYLHDDLINAIFSRLPAKSVNRFRGLSKLWKERITNPSFVEKHHLVGRERSARGRLSFMVIHNFDEDSASVIDMDVADLSRFRSDKCRDVNLGKGRADLRVGYCSGIICLFESNGEAKLWNPATRRVKVVDFQGVEGAMRSQGYGFGEICKDGVVDYKIVWVVNVHRDNVCCCWFQVYTLSTGKWHWVKSSSVARGLYKAVGALVNRVLHWSAYDSQKEFGTPNYILTFDLKNETRGRMEMPPQENLSKGYKEQIFASLDIESPTLFLISTKMGMSDLWILEEYGVKESWKRRVTLKSTFKNGMLGYWNCIDGIFHQTITEGTVLRSKIGEYKYKGFATIYSFMFNYVENLMPMKGSSRDMDLLRLPAGCNSH